jgi:hypothetical protein
MSNIRRRTDTPARRAARSAAKSLESTVGDAPRVVGGLLRGQPELALVVKAAQGLARLDLVDDRLVLVSSVIAARPGALVLPPFDADRTSTAPLVLRMRREAPGIPVVVISGQPRAVGQPLLRAAQAGAQVITAPTAPELHDALAALLKSRSDR